jgi:hypothetical protein
VTADVPFTGAHGVGTTRSYTAVSQDRMRALSELEGFVAEAVRLHADWSAIPDASWWNELAQLVARCEDAPR